jgi:hypothetical protein
MQSRATAVERENRAVLPDLRETPLAVRNFREVPHLLQRGAPHMSLG